MSKTKQPAVHCKHDRLEDPSELKPHPRNPRTHPEAEVKALAKIINKTGWRRAITVSNLSGYIVRGHGALAAAKALGCKVPVEMQDFASEAEENAHMIADNRLAELAGWNDAELASLLKGLDADADIDAELSGFDQREIDAMLLRLEKETAEEPEMPSEDADALAEKWGTEAGQLWEIGRHRILCGDSLTQKTWIE